MDSFYFIVNPIAGSGRSASHFSQVEARLKDMQVPYRAVYTTRPQEASTLAEAALAAGERCIVAVGGDGTINEVASVLCSTDATMGILPFGTGNDLARALRIPTEPEAALQLLLRGHARPMDAGRANERFFLNIAGIGFDVDVLVATDKYKKRFNGMLPYLLGILEALTHLRSLPMQVEAKDGETLHIEQDSALIVIGNGNYLGGGMMATPEASPFDGLFDICLVEKLSVGRFLRLLPSFIKGKHLSTPVVKYFHATQITVHCPVDCRINLDGEVCGSVPVTFTVLPGALNMIVEA